MRSILAVWIGLLFLPASSRADLAPPVPAPREVPLVVEVDEKAKAPRLIVPQNLANPRVRPRPLPQKEKDLAMADWDVEDEETAAEPTGNRNHLLIAGLSLAMALALGGLWLVRRTGRTSIRNLALLAAVGVSMTIGTFVWADIAPPKKPAPAKKEGGNLPKAFDGKIMLEMTPQGDSIRLVLDSATYEAMKKEPRKPE